MEKIKTIFLDRDGIVNDVVMRGSIISSPRNLEEFSFSRDFDTLLPILSGRNIFLASNQPDVARGKLQLSALEKINELLRAKVNFTEIIYCTHDDAQGCLCRKPKPGMIEGALARHHLRPDEAVIIGDSYKDILAGQAAGLRTIYCLRSYNSTISCKPDFVVHGLHEIPSLPLFISKR